MLLSRRNFFRTIIGSLFFTRLFGGRWEHSEKKFWTGGIFTQTNIKVSNKGVSARINGEWNNYKVVELSDKFMEWNIKKRIETLDRIASGRPPELAGPHSASIATYGTRRLDSQFTINNAVKGVGFIPKPDVLPGVIRRLKETFENPMPEKLKILKGLYERDEDLDRTKQISLELYTTESFETHTFLNLMENPICSIVFLDIPSFEIRALVQVLHPGQKDLNDYERMAVEYTNLVHSYFHGRFKKDFITLIFHVVELFDNTPGKMRGVRVVPRLERE